MQLNRRARRSLGKLQNGGNNRSNKLGGRNSDKKIAQVVYSEPQKVFVGLYLTKKGERLLAQRAPEEVLCKYRKNRYAINPNAKPIKTIYHERPW